MKRERLQHPIDKRSEGITANTLTSWNWDWSKTCTGRVIWCH